MDQRYKINKYFSNNINILFEKYDEKDRPWALELVFSYNGEYYFREYLFHKPRDRDNNLSASRTRVIYTNRVWRFI